jgi:hypothetical protein
MNKDPKSPDAIIYTDSDFTKKEEGLIPSRLLMIGFIYCHFSDAESHANDMWFLVNPKLNEHINKASIK